MAQYIDKDAVMAIIKNHCSMIAGIPGHFNESSLCNEILVDIDTLEVKEVGISIPNIDDTLKEEGFDPDSKEAKVFKESYYMALEKFKAQKGE